MGAKPSAMTKAIEALIPEIAGMTTKDITARLLEQGIPIPETKGRPTKITRQELTISSRLDAFRKRGLIWSAKKSSKPGDQTVAWYPADMKPQAKLMATLGPQPPAAPPSPLAKRTVNEAPAGDQASMLQLVVPLTPEEAGITRDMLRKLAPMMADDIAERLMILYYGFRNAIGDAA